MKPLKKYPSDPKERFKANERALQFYLDKKAKGENPFAPKPPKIPQ